MSEIWRLTYADYRNFRTQRKDDHPRATKEDFPTKEAAEARKQEVQALGLTASVALWAPKVRRKKELTEFDIQRAAWKMHA